MDDNNNYDSQRHANMNDRTVAEYDRVRGGLDGSAMFCKPTTIQSIQILTGKAQTFIVETARHHEFGDTIFIQSMTEDGLVRLALPPKVANAISRQRDALSSRARSRAAKILAQERKANGVVPGFMRSKQGKAVA